VSWAHRGDFNVARSYLNQAHQNFASLDPPQCLPLSWSETNLGNVTASLGLYDESLEWHLKAQASRHKASSGDTLDTSTADAVGNQNLGRIYWLLGRFEEARIALMKAIEMSSTKRAMLSL
jgi:tetratricopeptide (TPR) repeat protein